MPYYYYGFDPTYVLVLIGAVICLIASARVKSTFNKYSQYRSMSGMTGAQAAERILNSAGIYDVTVCHISGSLTDHYNPANKTVNLSEDVYDTCSVAAAAVAAHECGYAVQHAHAYAPLKRRSSLVPVISFASNWMMWVLLIGMFTLNVFPQIMLFGIILFAATTLFSFITLPVEIDASRRAVKWLSEAGVTNNRNYGAAVSALRSAAYTYVVAAFSRHRACIAQCRQVDGRCDRFGAAVQRD